MLGAIIGDIVGSRFEFNPTNDYNFELFTDECSFTDDTICTIAVADALLKGRDYGESIHEWCRRYPNPKGGYGGRFRQWVMSDHPQPYGSFGNGSAMRVSPIGWWFEHPHDLFEEAKQCAACTHNHEEGIKGAQSVAYAVQGSLKVRRDLQMRNITEHYVQWSGLNCAIEFYCEPEELWRLNIESYRNRFDETCQGTVPPALWIVRNSTGFEDAIRQAVSLGADADTIGAIVGSIAEAMWGIPEWMKKKALTYLPQEMKDVLQEFRHRYPQRKKELQQQKEQRERAHTMMLWKLGAGHMGKAFNLEDPMPDKSTIATADSWGLHPMPEEAGISEMPLSIPVDSADMALIRRGHIPEAQEDHWFMYCDDEHIYYHRSWTGMCVFEAHYQPAGTGFVIDHLKMSHALVEFGVNGDEAGACLFRYLLTAEIGANAAFAWQEYLNAWDTLDRKYGGH